MGTLVKCLGRERYSSLTRDFNLIVDKYRKLADASGYHGELRFKKNGGFIEIFVAIDKDDI
jgi:hypothetical protein